MDNNLFYEIVNASTASQVKNTYETAVANNRKYYRCRTNSDKIIGWDGVKHISETDARNNHPELLAEVDGEVWFVNPEYKEPEVPAEPVAEPVADEKPVEAPKVEEPAKQPLRPASTNVTNMFNRASGDIAPLAKMRENLMAAQASIAEMQDKYASSQNELITAKGEIKKRDDIISDLKKRVAEAEKRADDLDDEEESSAEQLMSLQDAVARIKQFLRSVKDND